MGSNRCSECLKFAVIYCECSQLNYCDLHFYKHVDDGQDHEVKYLAENNSEGLTDIEIDEQALQKSGLYVSGVKFPACDLNVGKTALFTAEKDGVYMRPKEGSAIGKQFFTYFQVWCLDLNEDEHVVVAGLDTNEICVFYYLLSTEPISVITKSGPISSIKLFNRNENLSGSGQFRTKDLLVASGSQFGYVEISLLSMTGATQLFSQAIHEKPVVSIAAEPSSQYLFTGCTLGVINILRQDNEDFTLVKKMITLKSSVVSIRVSALSDIFIASFNGEVSNATTEKQPADETGEKTQEEEEKPEQDQSEDERIQKLQVKLVYSHNEQIFNMQINSQGSFFYISDSKFSVFKVRTSDPSEKIRCFTDTFNVRSFVVDFPVTSEASETFYLILNESELRKVNLSQLENRKISPSRLISTQIFGKASQYLKCCYEDEEVLVFDVSLNRVLYNYSSLTEAEEGLSQTFKNK